jgi:ribose-phosphate pyrophosphokinase
MKETSIAIIDKRREAANISKIMHIVGDVKGKVAILLDDMIDTGGTIAQAAEALERDGASRVYACCTHAVLSGNAVERLNRSPIYELVITNTIPLNSKSKELERVRVLDVSPILGEAIRRIHSEESVSSLFV